MDDIDLAGKIKRVIDDRRELIRGTLMDGLLKDIEHYKSLQGELVALNLIESEISQHFKDSDA
jgi:hypothetical protein|tara:strand:- start:2228 stop:2416 length:189 start_codon:yes stop_codon:yes gene_type:complete